MEERQKKELKDRGNRALILNIIFFIILFAGMFLVVFTGLTTTAIIILAFFIISLVYIYFT